MDEAPYGDCACGTTRRSFVGDLVLGLEAADSHARQAELCASRPGLLQRVDPRIKLAAMPALIVNATATRSLHGLGLLFVGLAAASGVGVARLSRQVWLGVLLFTGVTALPAIFLAPGAPLAGWTTTQL
jgi:energy-coupling factor transporter transmembrane protein EcfT